MKFLIITSLSLLLLNPPSEYKHDCYATVIDDTDYALTIRSKNITQCNEGINYLLLEKQIDRKADGSAVFKTIDSLKVELPKNRELVISRCETKQHFILINNSSKKDFGGIIKAWTYSNKYDKIINIDPKESSCINMDIME